MSDRDEFEKWAWKYADDEDVWEDMGRDEIFMAGMEAARVQACASQSAESDGQGEVVAWTKWFNGQQQLVKRDAFLSEDAISQGWSPLVYAAPHSSASVPDEWRKAIQDAIDELSIMDESEGIAGWHLNGAIATWDESGLSAIRDGLSALLTTTPQPAPSVPEVCDGGEQEAFEVYAFRKGYDMTEHPLHYLFINDKTNTARQAWKAAISYCHEVATTPQPAPSVPGPFLRLYKHARGLSFGQDWNKGTAQGYHRKPLLQAVKECEVFLTGLTPLTPTRAGVGVMSGYRVEWECCGDETYTQAWIPEECPFCESHRLQRELIAAKAENERLRGRVSELEQCLQEARENIESWADYVPEYFREKYGLKDDLAAIDQVLGREK